MHCLFSLTKGFSIEKSGASGWADGSGRLLLLSVVEVEEKIRKTGASDLCGRFKMALKHTRVIAMIGSTVCREMLFESNHSTKLLYLAREALGLLEKNKNQRHCKSIWAIGKRR